MNYKESEEILDKINKVSKIVISCHFEPDLDSFGSSMALKLILEKMGKSVDVICRDDLYDSYKFLNESSELKVVDLKSFDFHEYELYIAPDSSDWGMVTEEEEIDKPNIFKIIIDHHKSNPGWGDINLLDSEPNVGSTCEMVYLILQDWEYEIDERVATLLMAGLIADTGGLRYPHASARTYVIASELIKAGADKDRLFSEIMDKTHFETYKYVAKALENTKFDKEYGIIWSTLNNEEYQATYNEDYHVSVSDIFLKNVEGAVVGIFMTEEEPGVVTMSFRTSRDDYDVSVIAQKLGGGGHMGASGARVEGEFSDVVKRVLNTVRDEIR